MAAPAESKAPALPQNMSREKSALLNLFSSNERLFAPLKESFFEWLETPGVKKDFGQMLEIIIEQTKKERESMVKQAPSNLAPLLTMQEPEFDDLAFQMHEWTDEDSFLFFPNLKTIYEIAVDECRRRKDESMIKALVSLPPDRLKLVFPWLMERPPPYVFVTGMLVGQFFHNLQLNFVAKWAEKHSIEGQDYEAMFLKFSASCHAEGRRRMMESLKKEVSAPDSKMSAAELDQAKAILSEVEKDPEADTKVIADKIRAQMRQRRVCKVCEKTEEPLSLCSRCLSVYYCSKEHQKQDWFSHKTICRPLNLKVKEGAEDSKK